MIICYLLVCYKQRILFFEEAPTSETKPMPLITVQCAKEMNKVLSEKRENW